MNVYFPHLFILIHFIDCYYCLNQPLVRSMFITKSLDLFFTFLLHFIHVCLNIIVFLKRWFYSWQRRVNFTGNLDNLKYNSIKLPHHIVFVIDFRDKLLTIKDIASLVTWSIELGINNISLFDSEGFLIGFLPDLEKCISNQLKLDYQLKFRSSQQNGSIDYNIIFHCDYSSSKLRILSLLDVKTIIAMVLKDMVKHENKRQLETTENKKITPEELNEALFKKLCLPDPDLAIICSPTPCLFGLLPWHIRLTEIIHLPICSKLMQHDFVAVLSQYTKCEQRFGK